MKHLRTPATFQFETKPHVLVVEGRYYDDVADLQLLGTKTVLDRAGATYEVIVVPGAFEIAPIINYAVKALDFDAVRRRFDGYVALGCILKGETFHHEVIGHESARALSEITLRYALAVGNGILTCNSHEQALERADPSKRDHGGAAADACLRMIELKHQFRLSPKRRWVAR